MDLWEEDSLRGRVLRKYARQINSAFAMASFGAKELERDGYNPSYIIQGTTYMIIGSLYPSENTTPAYAQIYLYDPANDDEQTRVDIRMNNLRLPSSMSQSERDSLKALIEYFDEHLPICNNLVKDFIMCKEINEEDLGPETRIIFHDNAVPSGEHERRYNTPNLSELCIAASNLEYGYPPIVVRHRPVLMDNGNPNLQIINNNSSIYDRLFFVLLFPDGGRGWHPQMKCRDGNKKLTLHKYNKYMLQERANSKYTIMKGDRLMQQYAVMSFARDQSQKLQYHRHKVNKKRQANYRDLGQNVNNNSSSGRDHGKKVALSSSFYGSVRWYRKKNLESLAIFRQRRKPDLFITITCDPNHQDILKALPKHQKPQDRPDIVARVFKQHLEELTEMLIAGVPGWETAKALIEVVEFQKRGLPHAHILVTLNRDHSITEEEIDKYCVAEIPEVNNESDYELWRQVTSKMIHGPCGEFNIKAPCCQNDNHRCEKRYPMKYQTRSYFDSTGTAIYKRRSKEQGGKTAIINQRNGDNIKQTLKIDNQSMLKYVQAFRL